MSYCRHEEIARMFECVAVIHGRNVPLGKGVSVRPLGDRLEVAFTKDRVVGTIAYTHVYFAGKWFSSARVEPPVTVLRGDTLTLLQPISMDRGDNDPLVPPGYKP